MQEDQDHLRAVIELAVIAKLRDDAPFAARIVANDGRVLSEASNQSNSSSDMTAHAEIQALRGLGLDYTPDSLRDATIFTSAEPCAMCAGAISWSGIGRVVFALDANRVRLLDGAPPVEPGISGRAVLESAAHGIRVEGGHLADEAESRIWPAGMS
jgi:tRNA(Arg) A34 adenosine deaminase TadA